MRLVFYVAAKEIREVFRDARLRTLLFLMPGCVLVLIGSVVGIAGGRGGSGAISQRALGAFRSVHPDLGRLGPTLALQGTLAQGLSFYLFLFPFAFATQIAAYSVVGEKVHRTLEPLLATPVKAWQLLLGKMLAACFPALLVTWAAAAIYAGTLWQLTRSLPLLRVVFSPAFLLALGAGVPCQCLMAVSAAVWASSRTNDPRAATQMAAVLMLPVMGLLFVGAAVGVVQFGLALAFAVVFVSALLAGFGVWIALIGFQREKILTQWK